MRMAWARTAQERTVEHDAARRRVIHPFAGRAVGVIAAFVAVAHLVAAVAGGRGHWFDEMYMSDDIDARVWLLTGRTTGWNEIRQQIRTLDVA